MSQREQSGLSRRRFLEAGGLIATLGAALTACGDTQGAVEPGRVGYAPPVTPLPAAEANDVVYLRTATSMEYLMVELYDIITDSGALDDEAQQLVDRLVEDHMAAAETTVQLTTETGGEPYECANAWYATRIVPPIIEAVEGEEAADVAPSDDPATDMLHIAYGFETMMSAMYQNLVGVVADPALRSEMARLGATAARHAAAVALTVTGTPEGYVSPTVLGGEETPDETGRFALFAIPTRFGTLAAIEIVVGAANEAGTRASFAVETPADNSYVFEGQACDDV